jgi:Tol biopolymer transport system component
VRFGTCAVPFAAALVALSTAGATGGQPAAGRLVFATGGDGVSDRLEIAAVSASGTGFRKLTHHRPTGGGPTWSPNGRHIRFFAYDRFRDQASRWRMRPDGSGVRRLPHLDDSVPSPDGRRFIVGTRHGFEVRDSRNRRLRRLRLPLTAEESVEDFVWSPDSRWVALDVVGEASNNEYIRVVVLGVAPGAGNRSIGPKKHGSAVVFDSWAPRRGQFSIDESGRLFVATVRGGRGRLLARNAGVQRSSWAPDGRRLAFAGISGGIYVAGVGAQRRIVRTRARGSQVRQVAVSWAPRGQMIAYLDRGGIYVVRSDGRDARKVVTTPLASTSLPSWARDGKRFTYSVETDIFVARPGSHSPRRVTRHLWDGSVEWSPDGSQLAFIRGPSRAQYPLGPHVYVMNANGSRVRRVGLGRSPSWAPDGRRLAYVVPTATGSRQGLLGDSRIVVAELGSGSGRSVGVGVHPAWSPDGTQIAFMRYGFGKDDEGFYVNASALFVMRGDGTDVRQLMSSRLLGCGTIYGNPSWSPDGSTLALAVVTWDGECDTRLDGLKLVDASSGSARTFDVLGRQVAWSLDGGSLAYTSGPRLGILTADGTRDTVIAHDRPGITYADPQWSPDGARVAYVEAWEDDSERGQRPTWDVYVANADGSGRQRVTRTPGVEGSLDWSAAGT